MPITINSRILLGLASIVAAAALIIGATFAFFSDTETSTGNTFTSGTLDLKVDDHDNPGTKVSLTAKPSEQLDPVVITLKNTGNNGGVADLHFTSVSDSDGAITEPECVAEGGTWTSPNGPCTDNQPVNDVSTQIGVDICWDLDGTDGVEEDECLIWDDVNQDGNIDQGELSWGDNQDPNNVVATLAQLNSVGFDLGDLLGINANPPGTEKQLRLSFHLNADAGNQYQGDLSTFDIEFTLHQANDDTTGNIVPGSPAPSPTPGE